MKQFIKEWAGILIALLIVIIIELYVLDSWIKVQTAKEIANDYIELIQEVMNYENNKQNQNK